MTRVALEVGTHGVLGGQAQVEGVEGTWMDLTQNVNVSSLLLSFLIEKLILRFSANGIESNEPSTNDSERYESRRSGGFESDC